LDTVASSALISRIPYYTFCGRWKAPPRSGGRRYHYYRCTGTDRSRHDGQRPCVSRAIRVEWLDAAVWAEVCRLLADPARVAQEYPRRLQEVRTGPHRPELETVERQLGKLRAGTGRLTRISHHQPRATFRVP
jgi:site-specific DNA recombinase